jgi:hypothetical protein
LLELLDVLKDFKKIPDLDKSQGVEYLKQRLQDLDSAQIKRLITYAVKYPPRVAAFLGALLDELDIKVNADALKQQVNPLSTYRLGITEEQLPTISQWNIS